MDRQPPQSTSDVIELYIRTYNSLLRSSGEVRVRAFEDGLLTLVRTKNADILEDVRKTGDLSDATAAKLKDVVDAYAKTFA